MGHKSNPIGLRLQINEARVHAGLAPLPELERRIETASTALL